MERACPVIPFSSPAQARLAALRPFSLRGRGQPPVSSIAAPVPFAIRNISPWSMSAQIAERYRKGRVFLAGDAAHRFPPTGGLGKACVAALAREGAHVVINGRSAEALDRAGTRLLLVSSYEGGEVTGVDLTAVFGMSDPVALYNAQGYDEIAAASGGKVTLPLSALGIPVDLTASHIAAGTNFPEHAEESAVEDGPFLFAKEVEPTSFDAPIPAGDALLDCEVELCFVALEAFEISRAPAEAGLILCNDVTDRAKLMRNIDASDVTSGKGFTTGKSAPGYLPVGNLFVIPRDLRAFASAVELRLWRGDELKQSARQSEAIRDFDELVRQSAARQDVLWDFEGREVGLPIQDGVVPVRTAILAGTPDGTVFRGVDKSSMALGAWDWLAGGWDRTLVSHVVERQIAKERAAISSPASVSSFRWPAWANSIIRSSSNPRKADDRARTCLPPLSSVSLSRPLRGGIGKPGITLSRPNRARDRKATGIVFSCGLHAGRREKKIRIRNRRSRHL